MIKKILIKDYAELKKQTLSNIYQKVQRGTLQSEKIDGKTYIIEEEQAKPKDLKKQCKKAKKSLKKDIRNLQELLKAKEAEIQTLKISFDILSSAFNQQLKSIEKPIIEAKIKTEKKSKKKKLKKSKK
jgi:hypothetical protein